MVLLFPVLPTFLCYCASESPRKPSHGAQGFVKSIKLNLGVKSFLERC